MALEPPYVAAVTFAESGGSSGTTPPAGPLVVIGWSSSGTAEQLTPLTSKEQFTSTFGHGLAVDGGSYALDEVDRIIFIKTNDTDMVDGAYGTIDDTWASLDAPGVSGDADVLPGDELKIEVEFTAGGTIGLSTGIKYRYRYEGGNWTGARSLGTDLSISIPKGGGKYNLDLLSSDADIIAAVNEARTKTLAHFVNITGSVHGAADTTSDNNVAAAAVTIDDAATVMVSLLAATTTEAHVALTAGTVHGAADSVALAAFQAIAVPTNKAQTALAFNAYKAAFNAHIARISSSIHGAADVTNPIAAADLETGVITAGDKFIVQNSGPRWSIDALTTAIGKLATTGLTYGMIMILGNILTQGEAEAINTALDDLRVKVKYRAAIGHFRMRDAGESLADYGEAFETAFATTVARRLSLCAGALYVSSPTIKGAILPRPWTFHAAARAAKLPENVNPIDGDTWGEARGAIRDTRGEVLPRAVDEGFQAVLTSRRCWAPMTRAEYSGVRSSQAAMLAPEGSDYPTLRQRRVADLAAEIAVKEAGRIIGKDLLPAPDGTIDRNQRLRKEAEVNEILKKRIVDTAKAVACTFHLDPLAVISGAPPVKVGAWVKLRLFGNIDVIEPLELGIVS